MVAIGGTKISPVDIGAEVFAADGSGSLTVYGNREGLSDALLLAVSDHIEVLVSRTAATCKTRTIRDRNA